MCWTFQHPTIATDSAKQASKKKGQHKWRWTYVCLKSTAWPLESHESFRVGLNHSHLTDSPKDRCSRPVSPLIQGRVCENM